MHPMNRVTPNFSSPIRLGQSFDRGRKGLSLIELLVVVAILAILAALLTTAVQRMRTSGLNAKCLSNIRQVGMMVMAAAQENDGRLVPAVLERDEDMNYIDQFYTARYWHTNLERMGYIDNYDVFFCPSWRPRNMHEYENVLGRRWNQTANIYGMREWRLPGVSYSHGVFGGTGDSKRLSMIENPSEFWLLSDSALVTNPQNPLQGYQIRSTPNSNWRIHLRHQDRAHTFFVDGHVSAHDREFFVRVMEEQADFGHPSGTAPLWPE